MREFALKLSAKAIALSFAFAACAGVFAGAWDMEGFYESPSKKITTLIVTSNYVKPRLIAELAQAETRAPYILLPSSGDSRIFFKAAGKGPALEVRDADLSRFINFLSPETVLVIGDARFVPQRYLDAIDQKYKTLFASDDNWYTNAVTVGNYLDCHSLPEKFKELAAKFDSTSIHADEKAGLTRSSPSSQIAIERSREAGPETARPVSTLPGVYQAPSIIEQGAEDDKNPPPEPVLAPAVPAELKSKPAAEPMLLVPQEELPKPSSGDEVVPK